MSVAPGAKKSYNNRIKTIKNGCFWEASAMAEETKKLGLYIHIPFCASKCDYCDFYSLPGREDLKERYAKALRAHMAETAPQAKGYQVDTVYFGGGTPVMLGDKALCELLAGVKKLFRLDRDAEITVEVNPDSVDYATLRRLRRTGFNRLSIGMQSAHDGELQSVHRPHTFAQTQQAVAWARKAKFKNISLDLIYGLPGQTPESWLSTLEAALALEPEHISGYGLKVEQGTPLCARVEAGETLPDDDAQADAYLTMVELLTGHGYEQYEISNFAKPGFRSRHNLKYWILKPYLGFGPGAHSDFGQRRYSFVRDLEGYLEGVETGGRLLDEDQEIPQVERASEYLMLRLRTTHGIEEWEYRREYLMDFDALLPLLTEYERQGWVRRFERRWSLTPEGFLRSNQLIGELLDHQQRSTLPSTLRYIHRKGI